MTWGDVDEAAVTSLFFLGHTPGDESQPIGYPREAKRRDHLAYYGTTRSGKTYAIEYALQQLAPDRSAGFCFIDPHGKSYWRMASFLRQHSITDRVLYWDINDADHIVTFDPFTMRDQSASYIAGNLAATLLSTLGRQDKPSELPHLKTLTEDGLEALLKLGLAFLMARRLFDPAERDVKQAVARLLTSTNLVTTIADMQRYQDRRTELAPAFRRIVNLFRDDRVRLAFAGGGVDFRQLMDEGWIVLINTEQRDQTDEVATLFTRLLVKQFFMAAKSRADVEPAPFFLAIDEASRYLTTDTAQVIDQTAKFGLYLLLGIHGMEQARLENEETYLAIRRNVNSEIVMRITDYEERLYFARRFCADGFDPMKIKWQQTRTVAIPYSVAHELVSEMNANTDTDTSGESSTTLPSGDVVVGANSAGGRTQTRSTTTAPGYHTEYEYREEPTSPIYWSVDEQEREAAKFFSVRPAGMEDGFGVAKIGAQPPQQIEIPRLADPLFTREEMQTYLAELKQTQPATLTRADAEALYRATESEQLERLALPSPSTEEPHEAGQPFAFKIPKPAKKKPPKKSPR